jgi:hypothetical protein
MIARNAFRASLLIAAALASVMLGGCEQLFTYTPFQGLNRPLSSLSAEQRVKYAQDALASGDAAAMKAAYDAIVADTSASGRYTAAQLGVELSGVPALITEFIADPATALGPATIADFMAAHPDLSPAYIVDAGARFAALDGESYTLSTNDRVLGAIGLALGEAQSTTPPYNFADPAVDLTAALALIAPAAASDPTIDSLYTWLAGL